MFYVSPGSRAVETDSQQGCAGWACKRAAVCQRSASAQQDCVSECAQECPTVRGWERDRKSGKGQSDGLI